MIGISAEHRALHDAIRRWATDRCPPDVVRAAVQGGSANEVWKDIAAQGWLGLHLPETAGGSGYGLVELAIVVEELGGALAPGPVVPTVLTSACLHAAGATDDLLAGLADGTRAAATALTDERLSARRDSAAVTLSGSVGPVLGAPEADLLLLPADLDDVECWIVVDATDCTVEARDATDATRSVGVVQADDVTVDADRVLDLDGDLVRDVAGVLFAAEAAGVARWLVDATTSYAKTRRQFGRPIGQFQAVKHRLADMLIATEAATALAWDAARAADAALAAGAASDAAPDHPVSPEQLALAAAIARAVGPDAAYTCGKDAIQLHGGIGFTWEHDAHLYLRRAMAIRQLLETPHADRERIAELALGGVRRQLELELPEDVADVREEVRLVLAEITDLDADQQRQRLVDAGLVAPHYPRPWGRGASPAEQLAIEEEFRAAGVRQPTLQIGAWALPTLISNGTPAQLEKFVEPTLRGDLHWCQLFSEPEAGSDLASLRTKAERVDGGWRLSGQKVWTSLADRADYGMCLARTDPTRKHGGITFFLVDMRADGVDVRPLTELTGDALFNEVFLDGVFVPDDHVVGEVNDGWRVSKDTLVAERVAMSSGSSFGHGLEGLLTTLADHPRQQDPLARDELGRLLAEAVAVTLMNFRATVAAVEGQEDRSASVRKLLGVENQQRVSELSLELLGDAGVVSEDAVGFQVKAFLFNRCLTIAGGTSEVQRNVIGERLLGLPKLEEPPG